MLFFTRMPGRLLAAILVLACSGLAAADGPVRVEPVERWTNVFGGREMVFHFAVRSSRAFEGKVGWAFAINDAAVARREVDVKVGADGSETITVKHPLPEARSGTALHGELAVRVISADGKVVAKVDKPVWIFPNSPFADRKKWLEARKIVLFDPAKTTAAVWKKADIPFEEQENVAALADLKEGLLVIGEGASFKEEPTLAETMLKLATHGVPVLCLAPTEGMLSLPKSIQGIADLTLRRRSMITRIDKRLDAEAWPLDGQAVFSSLVLGAEDGGVVAEVVRGGGMRLEREGWPWLELETATGRGRLLVCGFGIIQHWSDGPTPRFLLARLLERMTGPEDQLPENRR
jgi:hypothetical protein